MLVAMGIDVTLKNAEGDSALDVVDTCVAEFFESNVGFYLLRATNAPIPHSGCAVP